jgi:hypothetical protein
VSIFWLWQEIVYDVTYKLTQQQRRNRDSDGRDNRQMTFLNFNSYVQNVRFFVFQMDGQMDRQMEKLIRCGLGNLLVPPG